MSLLLARPERANKDKKSHHVDYKGKQQERDEPIIAPQRGVVHSTHVGTMLPFLRRAMHITLTEYGAN